MNSFKAKLNSISTSLNSSALGVRVAVFCAGVFVLIFIWYVFVFTTLDQQEKTISLKISSLNTQAKVLQEEVDKITNTILASQNIPNKHGDLEEKSKNLDGDIGRYTGAFVPVSKMVDVLRDMLNKVYGLKLLSIISLPEKLLHVSTGKPKNNSGHIYQHGVKLTFQGNYFATISYLEELEKLKWRLFWDGLNYQVNSYPNATVTITLHTLGKE
jgi:MSHA biogenesis protein MshJ